MWILGQVPLGTIVMWGGGEDLPDGWHICDGTLLSKGSYGDLWNIIGDHFGMDPPDDTQFYLPDLRGLFVRGVDTGAGWDPDVSRRVDLHNRDQIRKGVGSFQNHTFQNHNHSYTVVMTDGNGQQNAFDAGNWYPQQAFTDMVWTDDYAVGTETRPANIYLHYIIYIGQPTDAKAT
jgi:microcystin-dependent protein